MTVPVLVLMVAAMVTAMSVSLRDHADHSAAVDLANLRAEHAADAFVASWLTHEGCDPPAAEGIEACAAGEHVVAYDRGIGAQVKAQAAVGAC